MHASPPHRLKRVCGLVMLALLAGCSEPNAPADSDPLDEPPLITAEDLTVIGNFFVVCKDGADATFDVMVDDGDPFQVWVRDGQCVKVHKWDGKGTNVVKVTEHESDDFVLEKIIKLVIEGYSIIATEVIEGTNTVSDFVGGPRNHGAFVSFFNKPPPPPPPPPGGGEGCTPGYWKQPHHFDSWVGFTPDQDFSTVFEDAFPGMTLLEVLKQGGGKLKALGRHTVAALLNASSGGVSYDLSTQDVIDAFNDVLPGGDFEDLKDQFEGFNEQGCPLN